MRIDIQGSNAQIIDQISLIIWINKYNLSLNFPFKCCFVILKKVSVFKCRFSEALHRIIIIGDIKIAIICPFLFNFPFEWRNQKVPSFPPLTQLCLRRIVLIKIQWYNYSCRVFITLWKLDIYVSINLRKINAKSISADFSAHAPFMRLCARIANKMPRAIFYAHNPPLF